MAATINNFKIFDEEKGNLLTNSEYNDHTQRVDGFNTDEEVPSSLFNSVLRQNSLMSYVGIEYMKQFVTDATIEHTMNASDLQTFISNFFKNWLVSNFTESEYYNNKLAIDYKDLNLGLRNGSIIYSWENNVDVLQLPTTLPMPSYNKKYTIQYSYDNDGTQGKLRPALRTLELIESTEFTKQNIGVQNSVKYYIDLQDLKSGYLPREDYYELFFEVKEGKYYDSWTLPTNSLSDSNVGISYFTTQNEVSVNGNFLILKTPNTGALIKIGLTDDINENQSGTAKGSYLMAIVNSTVTLSLKVTLKERI